MYFKGCYWPEPNNLITNIFERMSETINAGGTVETPTIEELQAKLAKAEWKIVEMKKTSKETNTTQELPKTEPVVDNNNYMTRADYQNEEFFKSNPELLEHKDAINEKVSNWYSLEDAKIVLMSQDKTIEARKNTQNSNFTAWTPNFTRTEYSISDLEAMPQAQYEQVMKASEEGKVVIK